MINRLQGLLGFVPSNEPLVQRPFNDDVMQKDVQQL